MGWGEDFEGECAGDNARSVVFGRLVLVVP